MKFQFLLFFAFSSHFVAAQIGSPVSYGETIQFDSKTLNETREIWIYKPEFYDVNAGSHPVLYLLDGELHFGHVSAMIDYLSLAFKIPQMIVVGIPNTDRIRDFTPIHSLKGLDGKVDSVQFSSSGGGENFLSFLKDELIPFIDSNYRTQPYRVLEGHSLGGQFTSFVIQEDPALFQSYIIISPGFYGANTATLGKVDNYLNTAKKKRGNVFIAVGDEPRIEPGVDSLVSIFRNNSEVLEWKYNRYENEEHISVGHPAIYDALRFFYKNWWIDMNVPDAMPSYADIRVHFERLSNEFGYKIIPTEQVMVNIGFTQLELENCKAAVEILDQNTFNFPNSAGAYFCLGLAEMSCENKEKAISAFERSLAIFPEHQGSKKYLEELKRN